MLLRPSASIFDALRPNERHQDGDRLEAWWLDVASAHPPPIRICETRRCLMRAFSIRRVRVLLPLDAPPLPGLIVRFPSGPDASDPPQVFEPLDAVHLEPADPAMFVDLGWSEIQSRSPIRGAALQTRAAEPAFRETVACLWDFLSLPRRLRYPFCAAAGSRLIGQLFSEPVPAPSRQALAPRVLARVLAWMREHVQDQVKLADLACQAQVSQFHFARLFKATTNESPHAFLVRLRVECARELLSGEAHLTTATVAQACGFSDQGHLARQFRKLIGYSPAQYRRQLGLSSLRESSKAESSSRPLFAS